MPPSTNDSGNSGVPNGKTDYKAAGVDVEAGDQLVDWLIEQKSRQPHQERIVDGIGGFASLFRIDFPEMKKPCIITCTDGVGTKVKLASHFQSYKGTGQDLVAMCVNDMVCTGGDPLIFLDYYATGELKLAGAKEFLAGVREACHASDCALVGGETAEMPGVYAKGDYDCAGFAVGIVDEEKTWGPHRVKAGDRVLGVSSSGFHSNGYSLLRKVFEKDLDQWKDVLMTPTALYVKLAKAVKAAGIEVHAAAHITGGGIENVPRVLPEGLQWNRTPWEIPAPFREVQKRAGLDELELLKTLNCGMGFCFVLPEAHVAKAAEVVRSCGFKAFEVGDITPTGGATE